MLYLICSSRIAMNWLYYYICNFVSLSRRMSSRLYYCDVGLQFDFFFHNERKEEDTYGYVSIHIDTKNCVYVSRTYIFYSVSIR